MLVCMYVCLFTCLLALRTRPNLVFFHLGFWRGILFLFARFPYRCLLVPLNILHTSLNPMPLCIWSDLSALIQLTIFRVNDIYTTVYTCFARGAR